MLKPGLYEQVINKDVSEKLDTSEQIIDKREIDKAEAPQILSGYLSEIIEKGLSRFGSDDIEKKLELANKIVNTITDVTGDNDFSEYIVQKNIKNEPEQLLIVEDKINNAGSIKNETTLPRPETSMATSSLFTGAVHEPQMMSELKKEILSANKIDMLVSFIKWSGLVLIIDELKEFTENGGTLRVITTSFDYKRFRNANGGYARLLFVAHRKEILKQSLKCFRGILHDANFGELFYGGVTPSSFDALFISIDTFNSQEFDKKTTPDFYDFIIVDEFHHAAAPTYQKLLEYYKPKILLGLTATPERMDGKDVLTYFDNRIAAEIRLPEAIDRKLLCPFHYFGISDEVDLQNVKWSRGGYDKTALSNVYTGNDVRVMLILRQLNKYVADMDNVKGLGFCVSKAHAEYMAQRFNDSNILSIALTSESSNEERNTAQTRLVNGEIKFIFTVDLYNEGVDVPEINTVMFLRPTESLTVFLQQLGRGLRLSEGKDCLTVLDFIGQAHRKYKNLFA